MSNKYKILLTSEQCSHLISNAKPKSGSATAHALCCGYLQTFERAVSTEEKLAITFVGQLANGVIYPNKRRRGVGFLRITAYCSLCHRIDKKCGRYTITLDDAPYDDDMKLLQWVTLDVVRDHDHQHEIITSSVTGSISNHSDNSNSSNSDIASSASGNHKSVNSSEGNSNSSDINSDKEDDDSSSDDEPQSSCPSASARIPECLRGWRGAGRSTRPGARCRCPWKSSAPPP